MELVFMAAASVLFLSAVFGLEAYRAKREERNFIRRLREDYFKLSDRTCGAERFEKIASYYMRHPEEGQVDDITWNDLGMDDIFRRMNYTLSAAGEEYLYYALRTLRKGSGELEHFEEAIGFFGAHPDERVRLQFLMHRLGFTGKYSLYDYIENLDYLGKRSNRKHHIANLLFLPLAVLCTQNLPLGLAGIFALMSHNITSYFKEKGEIDPYIISFAYVLRLLNVCDDLEKAGFSGCKEEMERIRAHKKNLRPMRRGSFLVINAGSVRGGSAPGDVLGILMDYVRMIFHVDLIRFNRMLHILRERKGDVDGLISAVGYLETAVAVWIFRESLGAAQGRTQRDAGTAPEHEGQAVDNAGETAAWCVPEFAGGGGLEVREVYHPLIPNPVKNSIHAERGVLLTGSNASGKSTFLKTVAVNAILAQTIHTCAAGEYRAPFFDVYSSMALRDNLAGGESYFIVEIKALKRILDAAVQGKGRILCFVDEVLRGTNTVERIAASTQILKSLGRSGILCFAATHDIELTELLQESFDNYHFEEDIADGDVLFNYKLKPGKAASRNAIRLLELMGYDKAVVEEARRQAGEV